MPPHEVYIETHLRGGAVMRNKRRARRDIGIEIDPQVIELWHQNKQIGFELIHDDALNYLKSYCFSLCLFLGLESFRGIIPFTPPGIQQTVFTTWAAGYEQESPYYQQNFNEIYSPAYAPGIGTVYPYQSIFNPLSLTGYISLIPAYGFRPNIF